MKIKGRTYQPKPEHIAFPRGEDHIGFIISPTVDWTEFDNYYPEPQAPWLTEPGKDPIRDLKDTDYLADIAKRNESRTAYLIIKSIETTPDLIWDKVDISKKNTWELWKQEFTDLGLKESEITKLVNAIYEMTTVDQRKMDAARDAFLLSLQPVTK